MAAAARHPLLDRVRLPARLAEAELVERLRDLEADVDPDHVHQLERPHPEAPAEAADPVDLVVRRDPLLQQPQRLGVERPAAAVDEESRAVGGEDHALAHRLAQLARAVDGRLARVDPRDHLDEPHERRRVEEVHSRRRRPARRRQLARNVTGIEDVFVARTVSVPQTSDRRSKSSRLRSSRSGRGLDHEVAALEALERGGGVKAFGGGIRVLGAPTPALGALREVGARLLDPARERVGERIVHVRLDPGERAQLRDPGAHRAGADDAQAARQAHRIRSSRSHRSRRGR